MKYIILLLLTHWTQGCTTSADNGYRRIEAGRDLCKVVYGHGTYVAVREVEGNQILLHCGN